MVTVLMVMMMVGGGGDDDDARPLLVWGQHKLRQQHASLFAKHDSSMCGHGADKVTRQEVMCDCHVLYRNIERDNTNV